MPNTIREYNPDIDEMYNIDSTPNLYLTEKVVNKTLTEITSYSEEREVSAREILPLIESIHRDELLGKKNKDNAKKEIQELQKKYKDKYGLWPYQTNTFRDFYQNFIAIEE